MKINMDQILTGENNFNTIQDSLKIFKYKNELIIVIFQNVLKI